MLALLRLRYLRSMCNCCDLFRTFIILDQIPTRKAMEFTFHLKSINERDSDNFSPQ